MLYYIKQNRWDGFDPGFGSWERQRRWRRTFIALSDEYTKLEIDTISSD